MFFLGASFLAPKSGDRCQIGPRSDPADGSKIPLIILQNFQSPLFFLYKNLTGEREAINAF